MKALQWNANTRYHGWSRPGVSEQMTVSDLNEGLFPMAAACVDIYPGSHGRQGMGAKTTGMQINRKPLIKADFTVASYIS